VFLDECGFSLALHLLYGWGPSKERLVEAVPSQRGVNRSVLGAFDAEGMVVIAVLVDIEGAARLTSHRLRVTAEEAHPQDDVYSSPT
jgi:hypothetical protein